MNARVAEVLTRLAELHELRGNTVELAVRYVRNRASNYSPLTKGGSIVFGSTIAVGPKSWT